MTAVHLARLGLGWHRAIPYENIRVRSLLCIIPGKPASFTGLTQKITAGWFDRPA